MGTLGHGDSNPLIASPIYNKDGDMSFKYNRVKALHLGWSGDISSEWRYVAKLSHNRTWGTPHRPIPDILENFFYFCIVLTIFPVNGRAGASTRPLHWIWERYMETILESN